MKVLIVGCGAVGQVYGLALQNAGVTLGFLDQPATVEKLVQKREKGGLLLFQIPNKRHEDPIPHRIKDYQVVTSMEESRQFEPDQIWFTTPSQVYYSDWFRTFLQQVPSKRVVCFVPEGNRPEFLIDQIGDRVIFGGTTFMAWQGDLEGGGGMPDGINFWRSPLGIPLSGSQDACMEVAKLLKQAGFKVMLEKPGSHAQVAVTAVMTAFVAGLELAEWSLSKYRKSPWHRVAAGACREAVNGQLKKPGLFTRFLLRSSVLTACFSLTARIMPMLFPFDVEKYLKFHYTKTHKQSLLLLDLFLKDSSKCGIPITNIQKLLEGLRTA